METIAYAVPSRSRPGLLHAVTFDGHEWRCECEWGQRRRPDQHPCWHVAAVRAHVVRQFAWEHYGESWPDPLDYYEREWAKHVAGGVG